MNKEFFTAIELLEQERGIPKEYMLERVEAALMTAFKRENGGQVNVRVVLDPNKKSVRMFKQTEVVFEVENPKTQISLEEAKEISPKYEIGDMIEEEMNPKDFGRIPAQTAKQVIIQGIREAERGMMIKEYEDKKEDIVSAIVVRVDPLTENVTLDIGGREMVLRRHEQIPGDKFEVGEMIKVFITEINRELKGPTVILSRTHPGFVKRLFELEIPEIASGKVTIKYIAREAGSRTKIAVETEDPRIDPVGACIGPKGKRKTTIAHQLCNEKLDIIKFNSVTADYIKSALSPAEVESVTRLAENENVFRVIVRDEQLSLAIGRSGQNARLAAKLVGAKIDIRPISWLEANGGNVLAHASDVLRSSSNDQPELHDETIETYSTETAEEVGADE